MRRRRRETPLACTHGRLPASVVLRVEAGDRVIEACADHIEQWVNTKRRRALVLTLLERLETHVFASELEEMGLLEEAEQGYFDHICDRYTAGKQLAYEASDALSYWLLHDIEGE